ncbi:DUF1697 domain-containing protein [Cryobacterium sp. Hh7]|uniref:DUF1697 domain-containing protein n=1 Tax=Cryobacterium sp. Hh7 TaxID=1259159 RepID=UPI001069CB83|nr:DUF1697 domain-containing protein [Cryobacterium sp. Hh7]TFD60771.1 DUF1697 domain-containing protein [Cryobacterium sp. Hh7]
MTRYVALLRGINVNGITIAMSDLADTFRELGYTDVKTVLASGNVIFSIDSPLVDTPLISKVDAAAIKARIEAALTARFEYEAWIVLVDAESLDRIVRSYPFDADRDGWHPYVMFSSDPGHLSELAGHAKELDATDERIELGHGVLYWEVRKAVGIKSAFSKKSAKLKYRDTTTTRNLHTLHKLLEVTPG